MRTFPELKSRAWREMIINASITVYDMVDGVEANRRRPPTPFDGMIVSFQKMRNEIQERLYPAIRDAATAFGPFIDAFTKRIG